MKYLKRLLYGQPEDQPGLAVTAMLYGLMALSFQDSLGKVLSEHLSIWQFQTFRAILNILFVLCLARLTMRGFRLIPNRKLVVFVRSVLHVGALLCFFGSAPFLSMAEMAGGLYTFPLFVAVLSAVFLHERVGIRRCAAILMGFLGTLFILRPGTDTFQAVGLLPVAAGFFYANFVIVTRRFCKAESPVVLTLASNVLILITGCVGLITLRLTVIPDNLVQAYPYVLSSWRPMLPWMAGIILVCTVFNVSANIAMSKAYQSAESSFLAPFDYSYLIFASFWGLVFWGDIPRFTTLVGMFLIAASGIFVAWREHQIAREANA